MNRPVLAAALLVPAAIAAAGALAGARGRAPAGPRQIELSGIIEATEVDLRSELAGTIARVAAEEGERIAKGAVVCALDDAKIRAEALAADAAASEAEARLAVLEAGSRFEERERARARVEGEEARLKDAERDLRQARELDARGIAPKDAVERATNAVAAARAALEIARLERALVLAGPRREEIDAARAALAAARARADLAHLRVKDATIAAPLDAVVLRRYVEPGESAPAGALLATLADLRLVHVKVYVTERDLGALRLGAPADVSVDAWPGRTFRGRVSRLASEAEFTPRYLQTKEDRVKLVFEAKVDVPNEDGLLKPGMPADVRLAAMAPALEPALTSEGRP
jgi:HlyD family secretion protein